MSKEDSILIVDDDRIIQKVLSRELSKLGLQCATAGDGQEALEKLRASDFNVVLIDLLMPRMDGLGCCGQWMTRRSTPCRSSSPATARYPKRWRRYNLGHSISSKSRPLRRSSGESSRGPCGTSRRSGRRGP